MTKDHVTASHLFSGLRDAPTKASSDRRCCSYAATRSRPDGNTC
jgi:hypothetical protein